MFCRALHNFIYTHIYIHIECVYVFLWAEPISIVYIILILWGTHNSINKYIDVVLTNKETKPEQLRSVIF